MFYGDKVQETRQMFFASWQKYRQKQSLLPLEQQVAAVIIDHPEYQAILEAPAGFPLYEQTVATAVLATLLHRTPEICYVQYVARVVVDRVELGTSGNPMWSVDLQAKRDDILDHIEVLPPTQAWCLS